MRPLRLQLKGFGAFREPTEIDFSDADLVGFVGPTGSGKSTIIDAITFALYGSVSRYGDQRAVAPVVSALANEARVRLDFAVGETTWTVVRIVRRRGAGVTTREARLERDGETVAGSVRELPEHVEALLGLTFEQFTKTVVLPQGEFAEFLHQSPGERQQLLRRLFDLDVYERMGKAARERASRAEQRAAWIEDQLAAEEEVTEAAITARAEALEAVRAAAEAAREAVVDLGELERALGQHRGERDALDAPLSALGELRRPDSVEEVADRLREARQRRDEWEQGLAAARRTRQQAREAVEAGPDVAACRRLLERHDALEAAGGALADAEEAVVAAEVAAEEAVAGADAARAALLEAESTLAEARARRDAAVAAAEEGPDAQRISELRRAHDERDEARRELEGAVAADAAAAAALAAAVEADEEAAHRLVEAEEAYRLASMVAGAEALVGALRVGEPCPVCRQEVGALPDHDPDRELAAAEELRAQRQREAREQATRRREAQAAQERARAAREGTEARTAVLDAQLEGAPAPGELDEQLAEARRLAEATEEAERRWREAEAAVGALRHAPEHQRALEAESAAAERLTTARGKAEAARDHLEQLLGTLEGAPARADVLRDLEVGQDLAAALARTEDEVLHAEDELVAASAAHEGATRAEADARAALLAAREPLIALAPPVPTPDEDLVAAWERLEAWARGRQEELAAQAAVLDDELAGLVARRDEEQAALQARVAPWVEGDRPVEEIPVRLAAAEADVEHALSEVRRRWESQRDRRAEAAACREEARVAGELGRLLSARGFEGWLLEEALEDLVARATGHLLELSGGQYSLVAEGTQLRVRDHRNADEVRDARTLSGGETFLASLSLALALAGSVAELASDAAPRLESLFLDEGFGTLDPETLDVVAAALEELGASGRMVGVVTHIRELAERLPVRLEVTKGPSTSTVTRVEV